MAALQRARSLAQHGGRKAAAARSGARPAGRCAPAGRARSASAARTGSCRARPGRQSSRPDRPRPRPGRFIHGGLVGRAGRHALGADQRGGGGQAGLGRGVAARAGASKSICTSTMGMARAVHEPDARAAGVRPVLYRQSAQAFCGKPNKAPALTSKARAAIFFIEIFMIRRPGEAHACAIGGLGCGALGACRQRLRARAWPR